jgi:hypothetical protein
MNYADTLEHNAKARREPKNVLRSLSIEKTANRGVVVHHLMSNFEGKDPVHVFGAADGHLLAAHLQKHLGIKMPSPGAPAVDEAEEE